MPNQTDVTLATRERIVNAADILFYQQGFEHTSFSHIADMVQISRGNFYYHFKTKDEILDAVIHLRLQKTQNLLDHWEIESPDPKDRLVSFINILIMNKNGITRYGCPVGTLCTELMKMEHHSVINVQKLFSLFRNWLTKQFIALGCIKDAEDLAMHLLALSQGIATLAASFQDEKFIRQEVKYLNEWLDSIVQKS